MPPKVSRKTSLNYLLIVESSSKCSKIESYLGDRYKCIASNGHIRSIEGLQSIDNKNDYNVTYTIDKDKKDHIEKMRTTIAEYQKENVIIASDHDREGEAIAWHICEVFNLPVATTRRIVFHEITKPAILAAVANPGIIDMNLVRAQQARQVLDMLVGFRISPILWKHLGSSNSLSAGRCQTPALRLIYENEIEAKKKMDAGAVKHRVQASFFTHNLLFELDTTFGSYVDVEAFLEASKTHKHTLEIGAMRVETKTAPKPFNTATLLQSASNQFGMGAKDIMACCQTLYQLGHITYMRTESRNYSPVFIEIAEKYIADTWSKDHVGQSVQSSTQSNQDPLAHEAIRVTNIHMREFTVVGSNLASAERIYKMIWQNTVQSCMANATFNCVPLCVSAPNAHIYKHKIEIVKFAGFLDAKNTGKPKEDFSKIAASVSLQKGKVISYNHIETISGFTTHHSRYTEASLIDQLDKLGIGRPSTFSMLADVIQTRKYVEKTNVQGIKHICKEYRMDSLGVVTQKDVERMMGAEHNKLVIDPLGTTVIEFLLEHFSEFFSYDYTNAMETRLDAVAANSELWHQVCADCDREINKHINKLNSLDKKSYKIGDKHILFFHKNGMLIRTVGENPVFRGVRRGVKVDMAKLERGEYAFADLAEIDEIVLGMHPTEEDAPVLLKSGKFGYYMEWQTESQQSVQRINVDKILKMLGKTPENVMLQDLQHLFDADRETEFRILNSEVSVRNSKFGPYIFYKTERMKKPKFFDLQKYTGDCWTDNREELLKWLTATHKVKISDKGAQNKNIV